MWLGISSLATLLLFTVSALADSCIFLAAPPFQLSSDAVDWTMQIGSGTSCTRGLKFGPINISDVKLIAPPQSAKSLLKARPFHIPQNLIFRERTTSPSECRARM